MLTESQLLQIAPRLAATKLPIYLQALNAAMHAYEVNSVRRAAAFLAQLAHESGQFRWMEEIWGPTDAQRRYEPPAALAGKLGNTQPGDGKRYKGRGPIQITGRSNYRRYGGLLGIDLEAEPERAAVPDVAFAVAGLYWQSNHLNELADAEQFVAITKRINGGTNGLADRQHHYEVAKQALAGGSFGEPPPAVRGGRRLVPRPLPPSSAPLTRGHEALADDDEGGVEPQAAGAAPVPAAAEAATETDAAAPERAAARPRRSRTAAAVKPVKSPQPSASATRPRASARSARAR